MYLSVGNNFVSSKLDKFVDLVYFKTRVAFIFDDNVYKNLSYTLFCERFKCAK